jgi:hypothetical protein
MPRSHPNTAAVKPHAFDAAAARRYLAGVESLAREARTSRDPRVLIATLGVLERQHATVRTLLGRKP